MKLIIILCVSIAFSSACNSRNRESELSRKEAALNEREQQILLREKTLQFREEEFSEKLKKADSLSLQKQDSIPLSDTIHINPAIAGQWAVKMICVQTTCPGSAVGDIKTEHWELSYEGKHLVAKATDRGKLVRVYSGLYAENRLQLIEHRDSSSLVYDTRMVVTLNLIDNKTIEGQREIIRDDQCRILYALQMNKQ